MKRINDPEKSGTPTKWAQLKKWYMEHIHYRVTEWWAWNKYKVFSTSMNVLIFLCVLALPAGCIFGICKSVDKQNQETAIMDDSLGMRRLDPDRQDLKFYPVKIDGHDCWKYYSEGTHYIHFAKDCSICGKEIDNDTILIISGQ